MKKFSLLVVFLLTISMLLTACGGGNGGSGGVTPVTPVTPVNPEPETDYTETAIVKNGLSDYTVVVPENSSSFITFAGTELVNFIYQSTGVKLEMVDDRGLTYNENDKYLSIGDNKLYRSAGFNYDLNKFGFSDYAVNTKGNSLFMIGGNKYGTLYAVYEVLERLIGFKVYSDDEIYVKKATELYLPDLDLTVETQFDYRLGSRELTWNDGTYQRRLKESGMGLVIMNTGGQNHNSFGIMPKARYWNTHREWYSTDGEQLCYSQRDMLDEMVENLKVYILNDTSDAEIIIIGEQDTNTWCQCEACSASKAKYGSDSAVYVQAVNYVAGKLKTWQEETLPEHRPITYMLFAYYQPETPPMHYNTEKGDWEDPVDDTVICADNVAIWYAPITTSYTWRFTDKENKITYDYMKGWSRVCKNFYMWDYAHNFSCYLINNNAFNVLQDNIKFAVECGVQFYFTQASHDSRAPIFEELREYLTASLMWDANIDYAAYIDDFFAHYYKDAAPAMRKYFEGLRDWYAYLEETEGLTGFIFTQLKKANYWPKAVLDKWMTYIDEAYASIEYLKNSDKELYDKLYLRINKESLSIRFMLIELHGNSYNDVELREMKYAWKDDATLNKIANTGEGRSVTGLYADWGI